MSETSVIEYESVNTVYIDGDCDVAQDEFVQETISSSYRKEIYSHVIAFQRLEENWNGYDGIPPYMESIINSIKFLERIPDDYIDKILLEHIYPTNYGTIVIDLFNNNEKVSIELGKTKIGYYSDFSDNQNYEENSVIFNDGSIPSDLISAITKLYKTYIL